MRKMWTKDRLKTVIFVVFILSVAGYLYHNTYHSVKPKETTSSTLRPVTVHYHVKEFVEFPLSSETPLPALEGIWKDILHFVPENADKNCLRLFETDSSKDIKITPEMLKMRDVISNELIALRKGKLTPEHDKLTLTYQELARQDFVHTVCEIGFNIGQSAIAWLTAKPNLTLYSFDTGWFSGKFTVHMGKVLKKYYPGRFDLILGNSKVTVPQWSSLGKKCDIVSVDGDHRYMGAYTDLLNVRNITAEKHIIVLDDIYHKGVHMAWMKLVRGKQIKHIFDCHVPGLDIDYAIGYFPRAEGRQKVRLFNT